MLVVIAIIGILAAMLLPVLNRGKLQARRIQCVNNLKQLGLGFHMFMHDHDGKFPMQVRISAGGSQEFVQNAYRINGDFFFTFRHFEAISNEIVTPKIFACPSDSRQPALNFPSFNNDHLSYFVGVSADFANPDSILAGDRNITNDWRGQGSILHLSALHPIRWTQELHQFKGNLLSADGHVWEANNIQLAAALSASTSNTDVFLPTPQSPSDLASRPANVPSLNNAPSTRPPASGKPVPTLPSLVVSPPQRNPSVPSPQPVPVLATVPRITSTNTEAPRPVLATAPVPVSSVPASGGSGFSGMMEEIAAGLKMPVWFLYLLLVLLLLVICAAVLRQRFL